MFQIGEIYNRKLDIHYKYGGQQQGGISTPANHPYIFLFTGDSGEKYGYKDEFRSDGLFWYTGEGQTGDMEMTKGNLAIYEHEKRNKTLLLFEYVKTAYVRFLGEVLFVSYHIEERLDVNDDSRKVFIFHLALTDTSTIEEVKEPSPVYNTKQISKREFTLEDLKQLAISKTPNNLSKKEIITHVAIRSEAIKKYVLMRANGVCEGCGKGAPFKTKSGPFLEAHHVNRLSDGGPDHPHLVIALCPNCHREIHYGINGNSYNQILIDNLKILENS